MIEIKVNNTSFYKGCNLFKALTVFKNLGHQGQTPTASGDEPVMIRWDNILKNL